MARLLVSLVLPLPTTLAAFLYDCPMAIFSWGAGQSAKGADAYPSPPGRRSAIPLLGQTLSFHDAAHDQVTSLVESTGSSCVRLNIINRNVALVTAYDDAVKVLDQSWSKETPVSRSQAYQQLMAAFYSPPNLLLEDENQDSASEHRQLWDETIKRGLQDGSTLKTKVGKMVQEWLQRTIRRSDQVEDLYDACKDLGHDLALGTFLSLDSTSNSKEAHDELRIWSEEMLRGQFTLPLGINVGFFQNSFSRGQAAKVRFDGVVNKQLSRDDVASTCPFAANASGQLSKESLVSHHSMFSSSLVVKAFASLATALVMQLFRKADGNDSLVEQLCSTDGDDSFSSLLDSVITETGRLSPPIIGVMRRVTQTEGVDLASSKTNVPCGWDVWPYFPLANRDTSVFGGDACEFKADRYLSSGETRKPLTFGAGVKDCAGQGIVDFWLRELAIALIGRGSSPEYTLQFDEEDVDSGVRSLLGWLSLDLPASWQSVKQLPTQRPRKAIQLRISQRSNVQS